VRTVLSPLGLNIRAQASKSAPVVRTAAQGTELTVLAHTDQGGGWFQVKGTTTSGWITDSPKLTAPGKFNAYTQGQNAFGALYPETWTVAEPAPTVVVFRPPSGADTVVVTTAATTAQLVRGRPGYHQSNDEPVVVCGVTSDLFTYTQVTAPPSTKTPPSTGTPPSTATPASTTAPAAAAVVAERYLVQVRLTLDAQHALGIEANLGDTPQIQTVRDFVSSVKFPFPQCQQ
jgi:hypothetical protein